jgi:hypothetical protein
MWSPRTMEPYETLIRKNVSSYEIVKAYLDVN